MYCRSSGTSAPWISRAPVCTKCFILVPEPERFLPQRQGIRTPRTTFVSLYSTTFRAPPCLKGYDRECVFKPDDIVVYVVPGVYIRVILIVFFYVIGWHWICVIQLVSSGTLAEMRGVTVSQDDMISLTPPSRLGGDRSQCSDWLLIALQWAELAVPPMSVLGHTVMSSRGGERLYIRPVFEWCNQFATGSLLVVAPLCRQATTSRCGVVLCSSQVSAGVLLCAEDGVFRAVAVAQPVSGVATGSSRPDSDRPSRGVPILLHTQWVSMTLRSPELYDLDPACVPDVLGLHA